MLPQLLQHAINMKGIYIHLKKLTVGISKELCVELSKKRPKTVRLTEAINAAKNEPGYCFFFG